MIYTTCLKVLSPPHINWLHPRPSNLALMMEAARSTETVSSFNTTCTTTQKTTICTLIVVNICRRIWRHKFETWDTVTTIFFWEEITRRSKHNISMWWQHQMVHFLKFVCWHTNIYYIILYCSILLHSSIYYKSFYSPMCDYPST